MINYYEEFNLNPNMSIEEINAALFEAKKTWSRKQNSPNLERRQEAERKVVEIDECSKILTDSDKRKQYDAELMAEQREAAQQQAQQYAAQQQAQRYAAQQQAQQYAYRHNQPPMVETQPQLDPNRSPYGYSTTTPVRGGMSTTTTSIIAYFTWIGWLIAYFAGDREGAKVHLNQCLVMMLLQIICSLAGNLGTFFGVVFDLVQIGLVVLWFIGIANAIKGQQKEIPIIGSIHILK